MEPKEKEEIREHLRGWREKLARQLPSLKEGAKPVPPDDALGRLTRLDAIQSQEISRNTPRQVQAQLAKLEFALSQIDQPFFGLCSECDTPIPAGRLKAMPGALRCVNCA
jgi:DnaK suppressor protein